MHVHLNSVATYVILIVSAISIFCAKIEKQLQVQSNKLRSFGFETHTLGNSENPSNLFQITEESPNGTVIHGVAEYLTDFSPVAFHSIELSTTKDPSYMFQLLNLLDPLAVALKLNPTTGFLTVSGRIDRESICPISSNQRSSGFISTFPVEYGQDLIDSTDECIKSLEILITSSSGNGQVDVKKKIVRIKIEDINDNSPQWPQTYVSNTVLSAGNTNEMKINQFPVIELQLLETAKGASSHMTHLSKVILPLAYDPDAGPNGHVNYRLESTPQSSSVKRTPTNGHLMSDFVPFSLESNSDGHPELVTTTNLDFEKQSSYQFYLLAFDSGIPSKTSTAIVRVNLIDVNDETPIFERDVFYPPNGAISEKMVPGALVLNVSAVDADATAANNRLRYYMVSNPVAFKYFAVHRDGRITLRHWLDYESMDTTNAGNVISPSLAIGGELRKQFVFYVQAVDSAPSPYERKGQALVIIPVTDENDEAPIITPRFFGSPELTNHGKIGAVPENSAVPYRLAYIQVRDPDFNGKDRVSCQLADTFNFSLTAVESVGQTDLGYDATISEEPKNDYLLTLLTRPDRELTPLLLVRIKCSDEASNSNEQTLRVRVLDVNDETPTFSQTNYQFQLAENSEPDNTVSFNGSGNYPVQFGYRIGRVIAHDGDLGENAQIIYQLAPSSLKIIPADIPLHTLQVVHRGQNDFVYIKGVSATPKVDELFRIDATSGVIHALKSFDAENVASFRFTVLAIDQPSVAGVKSLTGTADVEIQITDINDCAPLFYKTNVSVEEEATEVSRLQQQDQLEVVTQFVFHIQENRPAYWLIGRVAAFDPDISQYRHMVTTLKISGTANTQSNVKLKIAGDSDPDVRKTFSLHSSSGHLRSLVSLDRERKAVYVFHVIATDADGTSNFKSTATATATVFVEDENDNDPIFIRPVSSIKNYAPTTHQDSKSSLTESEWQSTRTNEQQQTNTEIDGPAVRNPSASTSRNDKTKGTNHVIPIVMVHQKMWTQQLNKESEFTHGGLPLLQLEATDADADANGQLTYHIASGNTDGLFSLDSTSGLLMLSPALLTSLDGLTSNKASANKEDADKNSKSEGTHINYLLRFEACDKGVPTRCSSPIWVRMVLDMNELPLFIVKDQLTGQITKGSLPNGLLSAPISTLDKQSSYYQFGDNSQSGYVDRQLGSQQSRLPYTSDVEWSQSKQKELAGAKRAELQQNRQKPLNFPYDYGWNVQSLGPLSEDRHFMSANHASRQHNHPANLVVSEAIIICLVLIFIVLLSAAAILFCLLKKRAIMYTIATERKAKGSSVDVLKEADGRQSSFPEVSTCQSMGMTSGASVYHTPHRGMICGPDTGKISTTGLTDMTNMIGSTDRMITDSISLHSFTRGTSEPLIDSSVRISSIPYPQEPTYISKSLHPRNNLIPIQPDGISTQDLMLNSMQMTPNSFRGPVQRSVTPFWELGLTSNSKVNSNCNQYGVLRPVCWKSQGYHTSPPPTYHVTTPMMCERILESHVEHPQCYQDFWCENMVLPHICASPATRRVVHIRGDSLPAYTGENTAGSATCRKWPGFDTNLEHSRTYQELNSLTATLRRHNCPPHMKGTTFRPLESRPSAYSLVSPSKFIITPTFHRRKDPQDILSKPTHHRTAVAGKLKEREEHLEHTQQSNQSTAENCPTQTSKTTVHLTEMEDGPETGQEDVPSPTFPLLNNARQNITFNLLSHSSVTGLDSEQTGTSTSPGAKYIYDAYKEASFV